MLRSYKPWVVVCLWAYPAWGQVPGSNLFASDYAQGGLVGLVLGMAGYIFTSQKLRISAQEQQILALTKDKESLLERIPILAQDVKDALNSAAQATLQAESKQVAMHQINQEKLDRLLRALEK